MTTGRKLLISAWAAMLVPKTGPEDCLRPLWPSCSETGTGQGRLARNCADAVEVNVAISRVKCGSPASG